MMQTESIGVESAFINKNQVVLDFLKFDFFFSTNLQQLVHCVNTILSNIDIYNFNLS